jgi:hypothetical protein
MKRILMAAMAIHVLVHPLAAADELAQNFVSPPAAARPWVYWFWLNGNITREGLSADLEAMQRAGVGGVLIMEVDQGAPVGPVVFMSDTWRDLFKHMVAEANRLGIEVNMNNDAGWNGSGGPWVPLDKAMQVVVTSHTQVPAGKPFAANLPQPQTNEGFYRDIAVLAFPTPKDPDNPAYRVQNLLGKSMAWGGMHGGSLEAGPAASVPAEFAINKERIIDLTSRMDANGKLAWDAPPLPDSPAGEWTVLRLGHTFTGAKSHPAPATGAGPECDKLSKAGIEANYTGMIGKLVKDVGPLAGKSFTATHVDSWEVGAQNWTPLMRDEFKKLRGYDMLPYLPVLSGRIVDSLDVSERFLRDVRQTVSDLLADNYIGHLRSLANKDGLRLSMETYTTPANDQDVANHIEEPICEFWWPDGGDLYWSVKAMASTAHVNGLPIVGAEAFTADGRERWLAHPATLKALGDRAFCDGVNRFIVHRYAMQPWAAQRTPGMTMGPWGQHYERSNTWWEDSKAWHLYVSRCQYLLRQGRFVADVLSLQSEEPMQRFTPLTLPGYDYDGISPQAFLKDVTVDNGSLKLPSGMTYRLLLLPDTETMTPAMLEKITALVEAGATVLGKPPVKAPGLSGYPEADARVKVLADNLWSPRPGSKLRRGRIVTGKTPVEALTNMHVDQDFIASEPIRWIHRTLADKEVYFVANPTPRTLKTQCAFRITGMTPEAWFPDTGRIAPLAMFHESGGYTRMPLDFEPSGSMFVVFKKGSIKPSERLVSIARDGQTLLGMDLTGAGITKPAQTQPATAEVRPAFDPISREFAQNGTYALRMADDRTLEINLTSLPELLAITGPWEVAFPPGAGAPEKLVMDKLVSWSEHSDAGVKHFSGSATYRKTFAFTPSPPLPAHLSPRIHLDLGKVSVMAAVQLNGKDLGILWKPPYRVDITDAVKAGDNVLEVRVVNLPINRMIGDELLPEDSERNKNGTLKQWPQWLLDGKPSPSGRFTFTSWRLWKKDAPLQESGLLGPLTVRTVAKVELK